MNIKGPGDSRKTCPKKVPPRKLCETFFTVRCGHSICILCFTDLCTFAICSNVLIIVSPLVSGDVALVCVCVAVAMPPRYMDYYGGGSAYGYGGGGGYGYDDYYCNYGGAGAGYEDYGYEEYDFYSPMPYGMSAARGAGRFMYPVCISLLYVLGASTQKWCT